MSPDTIIVRYEDGPLAGQFDAYYDPGFGPAPMIPRTMVKGIVTSEDGRPVYVVPEYRLERREPAGGGVQPGYVFVRELGRMELQP